MKMPAGPPAAAPANPPGGPNPPAAEPTEPTEPNAPNACGMRGRAPSDSSAQDCFDVRARRTGRKRGSDARRGKGRSAADARELERGERQSTGDRNSLFKG